MIRPSKESKPFTTRAPLEGEKTPDSKILAPLFKGLLTSSFRLGIIMISSKQKGEKIDIMKKRILAMLILACFFTNVTACNVAPEQEYESEAETINITEPTQEESENNAPENEAVDPSTLDYYSTHDANFASAPNGQVYAYVPAWDTYFEVPLKFFSLRVVVETLLCDDYLWVMSLSYEDSVITTYRFAKDGRLIESHGNKLPYTADYFDSLHTGDRWLINCYRENAFYAFFVEFGEYSASKPTYAVKKLQSTDCGKTWVQTEGNIAEFADDVLWVCEFFTKEIGIFCTRSGWDTLGTLTSVTLDGGETWSPMASLPYPTEWGEIEEFYVDSLTYENGEYLFEIRMIPTTGRMRVTKFVSKDFTNWILKDWFFIISE